MSTHVDLNAVTRNVTVYLTYGVSHEGFSSPSEGNFIGRKVTLPSYPKPLLHLTIRYRLGFKVATHTRSHYDTVEKLGYGVNFELVEKVRSHGTLSSEPASKAPGPARVQRFRNWPGLFMTRVNRERSTFRLPRRQYSGQ